MIRPTRRYCDEQLGFCIARARDLPRSVPTLEGPASQSEASAAEVARAMLPINFELESVITRSERELNTPTLE